MPECNRVTPYGKIVSTELRGEWLGNRGSIHRGREIVRPWNCKRWITCALEYKGWAAPKWVPGRWTPLFFYDEALALAAGHRPCSMCRHQAYRNYCASAGVTGADAIDARLHAERLNGQNKRTHAMQWKHLPAGAFVDIGGVAHLVLADRLHPWSAENGYGRALMRPTSGDARALTPPLSVRAIAAGYTPHLSVNLR